MENYKPLFFKVLTLAILFWSSFTLAQSEVDTLSNKNLEELFEYYEKADKKEQKIKFIKAFLKTAKKQKDNNKIISAYYVLSGIHKNETKTLIYSDSIIILTKNKSSKYYPALAYLSKAIFFHEKGNLEKALDNYLLANKLAHEKKHINLIYSTEYSIGTIKRKIGEYDEALEIYKNSINILSVNPYYLTNLVAISNIYYEQKNIDSASFYNKLGVKESLKYNDKNKFHHFSSNEGIVHYLKAEYKIALDSLLKNNNYFKEVNDIINLSYTSFYMAKCYEKTQNNSKAILFHKKVDSIFQINTDVSPKVRESYEYLINYNKTKKNYKNQLYYINRLMQFDSLMFSQKNYLSYKLVKEYDLPKLNNEKKEILNKLNNEKTIFLKTITFGLLIFSILCFLLIYQNKKRKLYKKRFEKILKTTSTTNTINTSGTKLNIPKETIDGVLKKLILFENQKKFISRNTTLSSLAKEFNTNTNYLSKIINHHKNSSFSNYLNNLRIEFIIDRLKKDFVLRKYTIKAIAKESGFNNSESFSKAFFTLKGIKPSYFLKELEKIKE